MRISRLEMKKHARSETVDVDQVRRESALKLSQALACCDQLIHIAACDCSPKWKAVHWSSEGRSGESCLITTTI